MSSESKPPRIDTGTTGSSPEAIALRMEAGWQVDTISNMIRDWLRHRDMIGIEKIDEKKLQKNTEIYGKKIAKLLAVQAVWPQHLREIPTGLIIPEFKAVPISAYDDWLQLKDIRPVVQDILAWKGKGSGLLHSSALHFGNLDEEGEELYPSQLLYELESEQDLYIKIDKMFRYVSGLIPTERIEKHRRNHNMEKERIGLLIYRTAPKPPMLLRSVYTYDSQQSSPLVQREFAFAEEDTSSHLSSNEEKNN